MTLLIRDFVFPDSDPRPQISCRHDQLLIPPSGAPSIVPTPRGALGVLLPEATLDGPVGIFARGADLVLTSHVPRIHAKLTDALKVEITTAKVHGRRLPSLPALGTVRGVDEKRFARRPAFAEPQLVAGVIIMLHGVVVVESVGVVRRAVVVPGVADAVLVVARARYVVSQLRRGDISGQSLGARIEGDDPMYVVPFEADGYDESVESLDNVCRESGVVPNSGIECCGGC